MFRFLKKISSPFAKIGSHLGQRTRAIFAKTPDDASFEELERLFYEADLGAQLSSELVEEVRALLKKSPEMPIEKIMETLRARLLDILGAAPQAVCRLIRV